VPWLASQRYEYLRREMLYAAEHRRANMQKDHSAPFRQIAESDFDAIADYLSRLPP